MNKFIKPMAMTISMFREMERRDPPPTFLILRYRGERHIAVYDDEDGALTAMTGFVDAHWGEAGLSREMMAPDHEQRIKTWCAATDTFHMIGSPGIVFRDW